jgi:glycosyltransferase involved in cell wall biosynthesis
VAELAHTPAPPSADKLASWKRVAVVPAYNEEQTIERVIEEIRRADPEFDVVVIDDASRDRTAVRAEAAGATVVRLPYNLGIGGAVQTGYQYARDHGFQLAVQVDGDGQHDPAELSRLIAPILEGRADMAVGSRFRGEARYRVPLGRRVGIELYSRVVSLMIRKRVTDPTSGFRAVNRKGIRLFATTYPHDFPEIEANVLCVRHGLRFEEVPVTMHARGGGRSSVTTIRGTYFMIRVAVSLFISLFRRYPRIQEEQ